jgi:hypothetical protein
MGGKVGKSGGSCDEAGTRGLSPHWLLLIGVLAIDVSARRRIAWCSARQAQRYCTFAVTLAFALSVKTQVRVF